MIAFWQQYIMINKNILDFLRGKKNILAFSAGVDSTALFFLLLDNRIDFDIAIVYYGIREEAKDEVLYAKELAKRYGKKIFIKESEKISKNFEASARETRYGFFKEIIKQNGYENLLTAHHLGDRLEWFLMQLTKGSGLVELMGFDEIEKRDGYNLVRPLLYMTKDELKSYLDKKDIKYFIDKTNFDQSIKRNYFRHNFSEPLLKKYKDGIKNSFRYLNEDKRLLFEESKPNIVKDFCYFESKCIRSDLVTVDRYFKNKGMVITSNEKESIKKKEPTQISRKYFVVFYKGYVLIAPVLNETMDKNFKEEARILKIPKQIRAYLYKNRDIFEIVKRL